ncbi:uncharacterized protein LOC134838483 [Culicoides brevitarsis]|uniref:uncharacterized protein LOC134838483 n=1 Tax=Culicoides brevitarsis TaxID=469753 RepID=UPI00307C1DD7
MTTPTTTNVIDDNHNRISSNNGSMNDIDSGGGTAAAHTNVLQTQIPPTMCTTSPNPVAILFLTLLLTSGATALLCAGIMTNQWEFVRWDMDLVKKLANESAPTKNIEWMLGGKVARIPVGREHHHHVRGKNQHHHTTDRGGVYLVPMYGGIWTMCVDLTGDEIREISERGIPTKSVCVNYLKSDEEDDEDEEKKNWREYEMQPALHPQIRMQNLSISCSLVCLIILGSAALVGAFGVCQRQLSAILVTGVMYLLAALFAVFTLTIIHFKRYKSHTVVETEYNIAIDGILAAHGEAKIAQTLLEARIFTTGWSLELCWAGVFICTLTSFLWIFLSKILRWTPLSAML